MDLFKMRVCLALAITTGACGEADPTVPATSEESQALEIEAEDPGINLTNHPAHQLMPGVSGKRVVWEDQRFGPGQTAIFLYSLVARTEERITPAGTDNVVPAIRGNRVVYARLPRAGDWQLYCYNVQTKTETQFSTISRSIGLTGFSMSGPYVTWATSRNGNWDVYLYDLVNNAERRITTDAADQANPSIDGHVIAWADKRHGGTWFDLYTYDLNTGTEKRLTANTTLGRGPVVSGNRIVWGDIRRGYFGVYEYDLATATERYVPTSPIENFMALSGNTLAWVNRNDNNPAFYDDIFIYDFNTARERRVTSGPASQTFPAVSGEYLVWQDLRNGNADIYLEKIRNTPIRRLPLEE